MRNRVPPRPEDDEEAARRVAVNVLLILFAIVVLAMVLDWLSPPRSESADLNLIFTAPAYDAANRDSCGLVWSDSERGYVRGFGAQARDLAYAKVYGKRFSDPDTLEFPGSVDLRGKEGQAIPLTLSIDPGSMGTVWVIAYDASGNAACRGSETLFAFPMDAPPPPGSGGLAAEYHRWFRDASGVRQFGALLGSRVDANVDSDWGLGSPWPGVVPVDSFCVRWDGFIVAPTSGSYTLYVSSEDGFRLYVGGVLRRDWWQVGFEQEIATTVVLAAGANALRLEYFANVGHSACHLRWSGPGVPKAAIPSSALTR